jgi:excisionase family DNA binding protein
MEATQGHPNLLSEKQAAKRLGVARITLLRAREAGRIRFFRIGTRVLYCAEQLTEFLHTCERNGHGRNQPKGREGEGQGTRKENRVSSARESIGGSDETRSRSKSRKKDQASLPFAASR